jgi:hypothetical protein
MLIAAKWIDIESCDDDYQHYLRNPPNGDCDSFPMPYAEWQADRQRWNELAAQYDKEFPPTVGDCYDNYKRENEDRRRELLDTMSMIEWHLGY